MQKTVVGRIRKYSNTNTKLTSPMLRDMEKLDLQMKRLLARYETAFNNEGIHRDLEILEQWLESYRCGLEATSKISAAGTTWLWDIRNRLKQAAGEAYSFERDDATVTKEQAIRAKELLKTIEHIDKVILNIDHLFIHKESV